MGVGLAGCLPAGKRPLQALRLAAQHGGQLCPGQAAAAQRRAVPRQQQQVVPVLCQRRYRADLALRKQLLQTAVDFVSRFCRFHGVVQGRGLFLPVRAISFRQRKDRKLRRGLRHVVQQRADLLRGLPVGLRGQRRQV